MTMPADRGENFLGRWSRLKRTATIAHPAPPMPQRPEARAGKQVAPLGDPAVPQIELPLPSLDDIKPGADLGAFLRPHVPEALRRAALRKMWSLDPAIRDFREMADYDWDWNIPGGAPGFGPLDPKLDLEALARRVVLGSEKPVDGEIPETAQGGETATIRAPEVKETPSLPGPSGLQVPRVVETATPDAHVTRRRHGGAMPS